MIVNFNVCPVEDFRAEQEKKELQKEIDKLKREIKQKEDDEKQKEDDEKQVTEIIKIIVNHINNFDKTCEITLYSFDRMLDYHDIPHDTRYFHYLWSIQYSSKNVEKALETLKTVLTGCGYKFNYSKYKYSDTYWKDYRFSINWE